MVTNTAIKYVGNRSFWRQLFQVITWTGPDNSKRTSKIHQKQKNTKNKVAL